MFAPPLQPDLAIDADALLARRLAVLGELVEIGMEVARGLRDEVRTLSDAPDAPRAGSSHDLALTFARVARAIRQTLALEARLVQEHQTGVKAARRAAETARQDAVHAERAQRSFAVCRAVDDMIGEVPDDPDEDERLHDIVDEYLPGSAVRPLSAVIADIAAALGITPDWSLWADQDWAQDEAQRQLSGSPYAAGFKPPDEIDPEPSTRPTEWPELGGIYDRKPGPDPGASP